MNVKTMADASLNSGMTLVQTSSTAVATNNSLTTTTNPTRPPSSSTPAVPSASCVTFFLTNKQRQLYCNIMVLILLVLCDTRYMQQSASFSAIAACQLLQLPPAFIHKTFTTTTGSFNTMSSEKLWQSYHLGQVGNNNNSDIEPLRTIETAGQDK
ncbi:unnamed protein product [Absidia cylindrospora]